LLFIFSGPAFSNDLHLRTLFGLYPVETVPDLHDEFVPDAGGRVVSFSIGWTGRRNLVETSVKDKQCDPLACRDQEHEAKLEKIKIGNSRLHDSADSSSAAKSSMFSGRNLAAGS